MTGITYAKVGGPPDNWAALQVRDLDSGNLVDDAVEVNAAEGWAIVHEKPLRVDPETETLATIRVEGRFSIEPQGPLT